METFFERFGNNFYNKEFSPFRSLIFTECQTSHLSKLIKLLDYETNYNAKNYRLGIRYFDSENMKFVWKTTNNGKMNTKYWSKDSKQFEEYDKKMYFIPKMIEDNSFSHKLNNRRIGFYYKIPEIFREDYDDYNFSLINIYKMNNKIYGLTKKINSDIIWFDIDNHNPNEKNEAIEKFNKLLDILEIKEEELYYVEGNYFTGGIHCAIKLSYNVREKYYEILEKYLNENNINIECNFTNKILRLPCSYEYLPLKKGNIHNLNYFNKEDFEENLLNVINNINDTPINSNLLNKILKIENPNLYKQIKSQLNLEDLRKKIKLEDNKWKLYWSTPRNLFIKEIKTKEISKIKELYKITKGNRWNTFGKLVPYMVLRGYDLNTVLKTLQELNVDSKDMNNFNKLIPEITRFYNKCKKNTKLKPIGTFSKYISNINSLSDITLQFLDNKDFQKYITDKFIKNYIKIRNYKNNYISKEKYDILLKEIPYMIREVIGLMYYHIYHKKSFKKESMNKYIGFQLSYNTLSLIQDKCIEDLQLENNSLNKTSIQYLKKALLMTLDIEEISFSKRNWIKGSCKAYKINSDNDIRNMLLHLYNSCFKDIVNKNFILSNNNIYILYILLIENWDICYQNEIDFITEHIPISKNTC